LASSANRDFEEFEAMSLVRFCLGAVLLATTFAATAALAERPEGSKMLRHVVLFKFKDGTTPEQVAEVVAAFRALKGKIDVIQDFEYGTDVSTENRAAGFTHCFFVTFKDEAGRDAYLPHPAHKAFGALVGPRLDKVLVVDYWARQ
jgi:hypothetical protein